MSITSDQAGNPSRWDTPPSATVQTDWLRQALDDYEAGRMNLQTVQDVLHGRLAEESASVGDLVRDLKERYRQDRLPLNGYLQLLAEFRRLLPEEVLDTDARPRARATVTPNSSLVGRVVARPPAAQVVAPPVAPPGPPKRQAAARTVRGTRSPADDLRLARLLDRGGASGEPGRAAPVEKTVEPIARDPVAAIGPGTVLGGRFELVERAGQGGTGDVYRARDLLLAEFDPGRATVAVKILSPALRRDPDLLQAILKSASAMRQLQHPNIAHVFELHRFDDDYVVVMEWLDGESLARRLDRAGHPALSGREFRRMVRGVGAALEYAHGIGMVHGDVKPANVFLCTDERIKVLDFGFAGWLDPEGAPDPAMPRRGVTSTYASCEVLQGSAPTPEDDIYSLAALMYRMLAGSSPHGLLDAAEAERSGVRPARPRGLSGRQWQALQRGLAPRRKRLKEAAPLVAAFGAFPSRRRRVPLAAGMLLMLVTAGIAWLVVTGRFAVDRNGVGAGEREAALTIPGDSDGPLPPTAVTENQSPIAAENAAPASSGSDAADRDAAGDPGFVTGIPSGQTGEAAADVGAESAAAESAPGPEQQSPQQSAQQPVAVPPAESPAPAPQPVQRAVAQGPLVIGFARGEDPVMSESDSFVRLRISASGRWQDRVSMTATLRDGSARIGEDFTAPLADRFVLSAREPFAEVRIPLLSDSIPEHLEDFSVVLRIDDGRALLGDDEVTVLVLDDD